MLELVKDSIKNLKPYKVEKEDIDIKADANENSNNIINDIKESVINDLLDQEFNRYPDSDSENLRKAISEYCKVDVDNLICGNGSDEIIKMIIEAFVDKDEIVVTHTPTFSMYKITTEIAGGKAIEIESNEDFKIDINSIIKVSNENKAKVIFLCNPNNPTGAIIPREDIIKVLESTESIVVIDEAYFEFYGESTIDLINKYEKAIVLRTLSKAFGLAGLRVGYGVASTKMIDILNTVKPPYNLNSFSQTIGARLLKNRELVFEYIKEIIAEREKMFNELSGMNNIKAYESHANFIVMKSEKYEEILEAFERNKISVRYYGKSGDLGYCIRITVGTEKENKRVLDTIREVIEK